MKNLSLMVLSILLSATPLFSQQKPAEMISPIADLIRESRTMTVPPLSKPWPLHTNPPVMPTEVEEAPEKNPVTHTIKYGDNPWTIARGYGVPMNELLAINNIKNTANLQIGQVLKLPERTVPVKHIAIETTKSEPAFEPGDYEVYTIKKGDNPWTVARRLKIDYQDLINLNQISDPTDLHIGQKLKLPKKGEEVASFLTTEAEAEQSFDANGHDIYVIKKGDNPWTVARKLKIDYEALIALNQISDPKDLKIGQKLKLPKQGEEVASYVAPVEVEAAPSSPSFDTKGHEVYTIKRGDNPWTVARRLKIDYQKLMDVNSDVNPRDLKIGQKLRLPK